MKNNIFVKLLDKYRENKLAHAYLIETNMVDMCINDLLEFIKRILCENEYKENCIKCNLCNLININNLPTLKIIEPDGQFIKKQQISDLKEKFSSIPVHSKYNIYIIKNAERLNLSSANTMLKFLEEPNGQVLAFLITSNKENVLPTIQSRCQIVKATYAEKEFAEDIGLDPGFLLKMTKYIEYIEKNNDMGIYYNKTIIIDDLLKEYSSEFILKFIFNVYIYYYHLKMGIKEEKKEYKEFDFLEKLSVDILKKKVYLLSDLLSKLKYNLNNQLLFDKMVIEMGETDE